MVVYHDRNLIINYIPRNLSDSELANLFASVGAVKTCRIIRDRSNGASFGFGFCEYEDAESALRAIERFNGYRIADKVLKVSLAKLQGRLYHSSNLYVKNLPVSITDEHLLTEFSRFGKVAQCRVLRERESDTSKGSAYVLFENRSDAEAAKKSMDGIPWPGVSDDQLLTVKFAPPPYRQSVNITSTKYQTKKPNTIRPLCGYTDQMAAQMLALQSRLGFTCDSFNFAPSITCFQDNPCGPLGSIFPGGFVPSIVSAPHQQTISNMLWSPEYGSYESQPLSTIPIPLTSNYLPPYYFIQPHASSNLLTGVHPSSGSLCGSSQPTQLEGLTNAIHGCPLFTGLPTPLFPTTISGTNTSQGERTIKKTKDNKIEKSNPTSIYVYNIGNFMTESRLCELFSPFGVILGVSIPRDPKTNFARNFGFVSFNNFQSAQDAVNFMNGANCDGRRLQVSFRKSKQSGLKAGTNHKISDHKSNFDDKIFELSPNSNSEKSTETSLSNGGSHPLPNTCLTNLRSSTCVAVENQ